MDLGILRQGSISFKKVVSGTSLIAGTTVGAGMLGIPLVTAEAGFLPALCITVLVWGFMLLTGLLYAQVALALPSGANIFTIAGHYLGNQSRFFVGGMFLFLYYCLLIAYFAAGAPLFSFLVPEKWSYLFFGILFGGVVWFGSKAIDRVNLILTVGLIFTYVLLVTTGSSEVALAKLKIASWSKLWFALPILFSAFGYHNIVPSLCTYLERDKKSLNLSIIAGTGIALCIYLVWQWLILGSLSQEVIQETLKGGQPVTAALQSLTGRSLFAMGKTFAFFALATSLLGVSFSIVDFLNDGLKWQEKRRWLLVLLTFFPPGICAALDPTIFEKALGAAGGLGEAVLNGLLPALLAWKYNQLRGDRVASKKIFLFSLMGFSLFVMGIEMFLLLF